MRAPPRLDPALTAWIDGLPPAPSLEDLPPAEARAVMAAAVRGRSPLPGVTVLALETAGAAAPLRARLVVPDNADGSALVWFHGGGFILGDADTHGELCERLSLRTGASVIAVNYRLAPEHPFPAAHDDALASLRWVFENAEMLGLDARRIMVGGDSAGGHLAAAAAFDLDSGPHRPIAQLLLYPVLQFHRETPSMTAFAEGYVFTRKGVDWMRRLFFVAGAPVKSSRTDLCQAALHRSAPPTVVVAAGFDPLRDEARLFASRLARRGGRVAFLEATDLIHGFGRLSDVSAVAEAALAEAADLLVSVSGGRKPA